MTLGFSKSAKIGLLALGVVYITALWIAIESLTSLYIDNTLATKRETIQQRITSISSKLEIALYEDIFIADSLTSLVVLDPEFAKENWADIASQLSSKASYIRNMVISPNDVVFNAFPLEGNESVVGLDYRMVPDQYATILKAKIRKDIYLSGPVELVQGGRGLIARFPIFEDFPENNQYWGSVSVVFDYADLMQAVNIEGIDAADIAIRRLPDSPSDSGSVFYGDTSTFNQPDSTMTVNLPGAVWELAANYRLDNLASVSRSRLIIRSLGWASGLILLASLILIFRYIQFTRIAALQDELTHLPNRRFAMHQLKLQMQKPQSQRSFAVLIIDVNEFKQVNDNLGHDVGDMYLKHIANELKGAVRASDLVSRLGGDEFLIILHRSASDKQVMHTRDKIQRQVQQSIFYHEQHTITPSLSIGFAMASEFEDLTSLLKAADRDMYKQKQSKQDAHFAFESMIVNSKD